MERKGFAYIRTADKNAVKRQMDEIEAYCHGRGINDIEYFIHYGSSGNLIQNAEFGRLKESIRQTPKNQAVFVIQSIDRLTRDLHEWHEVLLYMRKIGIECYVVKDECSFNLELQQELVEAVNRMNPEYADLCDDVDESIPKLKSLMPLDEERTAMFMSDGSKCYLVNDEMSEMMALEFHADKCKVSENGRKIIMEEYDRQFPVADIANFMYPLSEVGHSND